MSDDGKFVYAVTNCEICVGFSSLLHWIVLILPDSNLLQSHKREMALWRNSVVNQREFGFAVILIFLLSSTSEATLWKWFAPNLRERPSSQPTDLAKFDIETRSFLSNSRAEDIVEKARHLIEKHSTIFTHI